MALVAAVGLTRLKEEEDLLVFLPTTDPDVALFRDVARRFGGLRVALIGVETTALDDVFSPATMGRLKAATDAIKNVKGVDRVMSMTSVADVVAGPVGAEITNLVQKIPADEGEQRALRDKVMSREHLVGNAVSKDGRAALIMVFLAEGIRDREVTEALRVAAESTLKPLKLYYGGAPFAGRTIYEEAQADVRKLSPIALAVLLLVVVLSFRDPVGVVLTIASVAFAVLVVLGGMGFWGERFTVASSALPVLLFASGSSYAVNILGRYFLLRAEGREVTGSVREALVVTGPPLAITALSTAVGFGSFVATDVPPMRAFGIACAAGVLLCWVTALLLVPAAVTLWPRKAAPALAQLDVLGELMVKVWRFARRRRVLVVSLVVLAAAALFGPTFRVRVRMEPSTFFRPGSEPWQAERFLAERFGGAHFVQVAVSGDFDDPATLRELARLDDFTRAIPGVSQVQSVLLPLRTVNDVMGGGARLPSTAKQAANLYFFLEGEPGMASLIALGRKEALMHLRVRDHAEQVVEALEGFVARELRARPAAPTPEDLAARVGWTVRAVTGGEVADPARLVKTMRVLAPPGDRDEGWTARRQALVRAFLDSEEAPPMAAQARQRVAEAVAAAQDPRPILVAAAPSPEEGELAAGALEARLSDARRDLAVDRALPLLLEAAGLGALDESLRPELERRLRRVLDDRFLPAIAEAPAPLSAKVAGEPILDRGFSRSVDRNQIRSLCIAIPLVYLLLVILFRSAYLAIVCQLPALLTLVGVFGTMGLFGISIDLGTSLVAGIATGAGSDFALSYMWYIRKQPADEVTRSFGPVMLVSVLLVASGFFVLALGQSPVMRLFGTLAGAAMAVAALLTCLLVPALLNKVASGESPKAQGGSAP